MMHHLVIAPVLLPFLAGVALLAMRRLRVTLQRRVAVAAAILQIGLAAALLQAVSGGDILVYSLGDWPAPWGIVLVADRLAAWMVLITTVLGLFALLGAVRGADSNGEHFHVLFQMQLFGLAGAFLTGDLFNLFVFFEVLLLSSYALMLHGGGAARVRASMHYVVINLLGSTLFLFAAGVFYGVLGTLNLADLAVKVAQTPPENVGLVRVAGLLLFGVFALKAALLPLYLWLPNAYANTSAPVAALFVIMTKVGAYSILRMHTLVFGEKAGPLANLYQPWLLPLALATLLIGTFGVIAATRLRQQTAYLVVASIGTLLTAFALGSNDGIAAGLYYLPHSTFAVAALVLLIDSIAKRRSTAADKFEADWDIPLAGLWGGLFFVTAVLVVGLPPFSGFISKFLILRAALDHSALPWVMSVVLFCALLGVVALVRAGSLLFLRSESVGVTRVPLGPVVTEAAPIIGLLLLCAGLTAWAESFTAFTGATAEQLLHPGDYSDAVLSGPST